VPVNFMAGLERVVAVFVEADNHVLRYNKEIVEDPDDERTVRNLKVGITRTVFANLSCHSRFANLSCHSRIYHEARPTHKKTQEGKRGVATVATIA
jgi:hypothetical protein